jgi:hypothetical protein
MRIHVFLGQEPNKYKGENAPEVLTCWDEFCIDNYYEGWEKAKEDAYEDRGGKNTFIATAEVIVDVPALFHVFDEIVLEGTLKEIKGGQPCLTC